MEQGSFGQLPTDNEIREKIRNGIRLNSQEQERYNELMDEEIEDRDLWKRGKKK